MHSLGGVWLLEQGATDKLKLDYFKEKSTLLYLQGRFKECQTALQEYEACLDLEKEAILKNDGIWALIDPDKKILYFQFFENEKKWANITSLKCQ